MGGNRCSFLKNLRNIFIVWVLTGLWHGANWTFVCWGLENFILLFFEKKTGYGKKWKLPFGLTYIYPVLAYMFGMVFFFSPDVVTAINFIKQMFVPDGIPVLGTSAAAAFFYVKDNILFFIAGIAFATPVGKKLDRFPAVKRVLLIAVFMISIVYILKGGYSPFIYFNF
jgi:alginate O-acetyltransferase complex protein AlgI